MEKYDGLIPSVQFFCATIVTILTKKSDVFLKLT
mgnify:CR=1 FL=1